MSEGSFVPSERDISDYEALKPELLRHLRKGKIFRTQSCPGHVGLVNQGATCYLNSLIQSLFHSSGFRDALLATESNTKIVTALKKLFASLILSEDCAVSTKDLTNAFGWSNADVFDQHDVQELFCSMTDALSQESPELEKFFSDHFKGSQSDILECPSCGFKSENTTTYQDIPINLPHLTPEEEAKGLHLRELLANVTATEVLDADNLWNCGQCAKKVQARKTARLDSLPPTLFLHIKRLGYDNATQQRKKMSTPVYFPVTVPATAVQPDATSDDYRLRAVMIHSGTASGGHYKAYINSKDKWYEYDDSTVVELTVDDVSKMFWYNNPDDAKAKAEQMAGDFMSKGFSIYEGAYMLVYDQGLGNSDAAPIVSDELAAEVRAANEHLAHLKRAYEVHRIMTEINCFKINADAGTHVKACNVALPPIATFLIGTKSLNDARQTLYDSFVRAGVIDASATGISMTRLRRYNPSSRMVGETFTSREDTSLSDLGLSPLCSLALEVLSPGEAFADFNPKEMELRLLEFKDGSLPSFESDVADVFVTVAGEENATVGALRQKVAEVLGVDIVDRVVLALPNSKTYFTELSTDESILSSECKVHSGDDIIVAVLPTTESRHHGTGEALVEAVRCSKRNIVMSFNSLDSTTAEEDLAAVTYDKTVTVSLDSTLGDLKQAIATALNISVDSFFLRRNATSPQLKKLNKSLDEIGFVDHSIIHVQAGRQVAPGEHVVICEVDVTNDSDDWRVTPEQTNLVLGEFIVKERGTVSFLKEQLLEKWDELVGAQKGAVGTPQSVSHLRVRDGLPGSQNGPLRDSRVLGRCLVGLADGRKIVLQVLPEPENLGPDNLYISTRIISFKDKIVSRPLGMCIARACTVQELYRIFLEKYPQLGEDAPPAEPDMAIPESRILSMAKGYSTGPPISVKSSLKLKWNEDAVLRDPSATIDKPPLGLRDGSVLVLRNIVDYEKAREAAKARAAERPDSAADSPARGRIRPGSRVRSRGGRRPAPAEKGIKIQLDTENIENGAAPSLPDPSPNKDGSTDIAGKGGAVMHSPRMALGDNITDEKNGLSLPNAPVRVVKSLRSPRPGDDAQ